MGKTNLTQNAFSSVMGEGLGTMMFSELVWELTDTANYLMVLPNAVGLTAGSVLVEKLLKEGREAAVKSKTIFILRKAAPTGAALCCSFTFLAGRSR